MYGEFKQFFPTTLLVILLAIMITTSPRLTCLVSDTYIEKDLSINEELDKLRLQATSELLTGRRDIIVVVQA